MANIIELIQQKLNYSSVKKVDPNTQETIKENDSLAQAAVPATLVGFYELSRVKTGAAKILSGNFSPDILSDIFGEKKTPVVEHVAKYASMSNEVAENEMQKVAQVTCEIVQAGAGNSEQAVMDYFTAERNNILKSLPAKLQIGQILGDNMLDDRTNKMEGPVSGMMHKIEQLFAGTPGKSEE